MLTVTAVDVVWTVLAAGAGRGRRADGPRHQFLAVVGVAIMVGMPLRPAGLLERGYFVGYNLFTLGTNAYIAGDGLWQLLPIAIGANGLVFLTLGISYLVPGGLRRGRAPANGAYMFSMGETPDGRAWTGSGFGALGPHRVALAPVVHLAAERRLTYPALAFMHSAPEQASTSVSLVVLDDAVTRLRQAFVGTFLESAGDSLVVQGAEPLRGDRCDREVWHSDPAERGKFAKPRGRPKP